MLISLHTRAVKNKYVTVYHALLTAEFNKKKGLALLALKGVYKLRYCNDSNSKFYFKSRKISD